MSAARLAALHRAFRCVLIDLDDTLYRAEEVANTVRLNIQAYMGNKLGIASDQIATLTEELYMSHGTTMAGLVARGYSIDYDDFHAHVHGTLQYTEFLRPDPSLRDILRRISLPKYLLTNADIKHAQTCLSILGIQDCFKDLLCFEHINEEGRRRGLVTTDFPVLCKPSKKAFEVAMHLANAEAESTVFIDDSVRNIMAAHEMGIFTVLVGREGAVAGADVTIPTILDLPAALPQIMDLAGAVHEQVEPLIPVVP